MTAPTAAAEAARRRTMRALTASAVTLAKAEVRAATARAYRDRLIREATEAGIPITHVAESAGISRQTVYDIVGRKVS